MYIYLIMEEVDKINKKCSKCKTDKELTEFGKDKGTICGVRNVCTQCTKDERALKQGEIVKKRIELLHIEGEIWKSVTNFDKYLVSNLGRVMIVRTGKLITPYIANEYLKFNFSDNDGNMKNLFIHRMVGLAFIPNLDQKPTINHLNKIRNDNRVENLVWATNKEQNAHKFSVKPPEKKRTTIAKTDLSEFENEVWKDIEDHPLYKVSNYGRIKYTTQTTGITRITEGRTTPGGYKVCSIKLDKGKKELLIHRLVANAFLDNPFQKPLVNHKNGIKHDNHLENLEFSTSGENQQHAHDTGLCKSKKEIYQLNEKNEILKIWQSISEAAKNCNVTISSVSHCLRGKSPTAAGFYWSYAQDYAVIKVKVEKKLIGVNQIDIKTGKIIKIWDDIDNAILYFSTLFTNKKSIKGNIKKSIKGNIKTCIKKKQKTAYGYKWTYTE